MVVNRQLLLRGRIGNYGGLRHSNEKKPPVVMVWRINSQLLLACYMQYAVHTSSQLCSWGSLLDYRIYCI